MTKLNIIKYYLKKNRCYKQAAKRTPIGIQLHSIGTAQGTATSVADYWNQVSVSAAVTYICDADTAGKVLQCLPEDYYTWADGGYGNRNLITIEMCESDWMKYKSGTAEYSVTDSERFENDIFRAYDTAVALCADICTRYHWDPKSKLDSGLYLISSHDEGRKAGLSTAHVDPTHIFKPLGLTMDMFRQAVANRMSNSDEPVSDVASTKWYRVRKEWTNSASQIGAFEVLENAKAACPYGYSVFDEEGKKLYTNKTKPKGGTQAAEFASLSEGKAAEKILNIVYACDQSGIKPSVSAAQFILESGYGKTALCKAANNCFGMKANLSGNTWGSVWDGKSVVTLPTQEEVNGAMITINAAFRKYPDIETSIRDHSCYLLGAMNGSKKRYAGLVEAKDYKEAITIIKKGGYATDSKYVQKICNIIQRFGLDRYDAVTDVRPVDPTPEPTPEPAKTTKTVWRVQIGRYTWKKNANRRAAQVKERCSYDTGVERLGLEWQATCGSFEEEARANKRANELRNVYKIDCEVKETQIEI